ncbi:hypothetical protein K4K59_008493 [Colletotrichum sp. SAR11_240]|nr:hypothetical protein K4K59_008493 [Colletotrichum sp. SAR11_240]
MAPGPSDAQCKIALKAIQDLTSKIRMAEGVTGSLGVQVLVDLDSIATETQITGNTYKLSSCHVYKKINRSLVKEQKGPIGEGYLWALAIRASAMPGCNLDGLFTKKTSLTATIKAMYNLVETVKTGGKLTKELVKAAYTYNLPRVEYSSAWAKKAGFFGEVSDDEDSEDQPLAVVTTKKPKNASKTKDARDETRRKAKKGKTQVETEPGSAELKTLSFHMSPDPEDQVVVTTDTPANPIQTQTTIPHVERQTPKLKSTTQNQQTIEPPSQERYNLPPTNTTSASAQTATVPMSEATQKAPHSNLKFPVTNYPKATKPDPTTKTPPVREENPELNVSQVRRRPPFELTTTQVNQIRPAHPVPTTTPTQGTLNNHESGPSAPVTTETNPVSTQPQWPFGSIRSRVPSLTQRAYSPTGSSQYGNFAPYDTLSTDGMSMSDSDPTPTARTTNDVLLASMMQEPYNSDEEDEPVFTPEEVDAQLQGFATAVAALPEGIRWGAATMRLAKLMVEELGIDIMSGTHQYFESLVNQWDRQQTTRPTPRTRRTRHPRIRHHQAPVYQGWETQADDPPQVLQARHAAQLEQGFQRQPMVPGRQNQSNHDQRQREVYREYFDTNGQDQLDIRERVQMDMDRLREHRDEDGQPWSKRPKS